MISLVVIPSSEFGPDTPSKLKYRNRLLAELLKVADDARESWRETKSSKYRADRLARHVADAYEALAHQPPPRSGEGTFYRMLEHVLASVGLDNEVSAADLGRREAERRRAAPHSGEIPAWARNSPTKPS